MRRMLITLTFSVVAMKSRTFFSGFSCSAKEQGMQELGGSIARKIAKLADGNVPYHRCHVQFTHGCWLGDRKLSSLFLSLVSVSLNPLSARSSDFFWAANQSSGGKKMCFICFVLHIHFYNCSYIYYY